jgi:hypothetical protein
MLFELIKFNIHDINIVKNTNLHLYTFSHFKSINVS